MQAKQELMIAAREDKSNMLIIEKSNYKFEDRWKKGTKNCGMREYGESSSECGVKKRRERKIERDRFGFEGCADRYICYLP